MIDIPEIGDIVFRQENAEWEVFVDTDGDRSIRAATGTEPILHCINCGHQFSQHLGFTAMDLDWHTPCSVEDCGCHEFGYPE